MRRLHLFEFNDSPWFPAVLRDYMRDYLHEIERFGSPTAPIVPLIEEALGDHSRIVDLCAGGGGPILALQEMLEVKGRPVDLVLTDLYPNLPAFELGVAGRRDRSFVRDSVDAARVPGDLTGLRTMFNALHHFPPALAREVLADAARARQPILAVEATERSLTAVLSMLFVPILVCLVTPWIRPFRVSRLLLTYAFPILPWTIGWDGFVSCLRTYSPAELLALAGDVGDGTYAWSAGTVSVPRSPLRLTWLMGRPLSP